MLLLNYNKERDALFITLDLTTMTWSDAQEYINFFKSCYLKYHPTLKIWEVPAKKFIEFKLRAEKSNIDFSLSSEAELIVLESKPKRETKFFRNEIFDESVVNHNEVKLFNYQKEIINWQIQRSRSYNAAEPGLGKSLMTICTISHCMKHKKIDSVFLIVKNGLSYHWKRELLHYSTMFEEKDIDIINKDNKEDIFSKIDKKILIVPDHLVAACFYYYRLGNKKKRQKLSSLRWGFPLLDLNNIWHKQNICLVVDESHVFKSNSAVKSKSLQAHIKYFDYRIFLSATPAINSFCDWFFQLNLLDKGILGMSEKAATLYVAKEIGTKYNPDEITEYDLDKVEELRHKFSYNVIRKAKADIPELKTQKIISTVYFELNHHQKLLYEAISNYYFLKKEQDKIGNVTYKEIMQKFPYLIQVVENSALLKNKLESKDINTLINKIKLEEDEKFIWLEGYLNYKINELKEKVILYDIHPLTLNMLEMRFSQYKPLKIHGELGLDAEEKQKVQDQFNFEDENKLILLSFMTSSTGINLQYGSSTIIMYTLPSDATLYRQALERTDRANSTKDSEIKICVYDKTFDYIRYQRTINRAELNDNFLNKSYSFEDLKKLFQGI